MLCGCWRAHHRNLIIQLFLTVPAATDNESPEPASAAEWLCPCGIYGIPADAAVPASRRYSNHLPITRPLRAHLTSSHITSSNPLTPIKSINRHFAIQFRRWRTSKKARLAIDDSDILEKPENLMKVTQKT